MRFLFLLFVCATWLSGTPAEAIPSFARDTRLSCSTCHVAGSPQLNFVGRDFQERGYRLPKGAAAETQEEKEKASEELSLNLRVQNSIVLRRSVQDGENRHEFNMPVKMQLISAGAVGDKVSYYVDFPFYREGHVDTLAQAFVQLNRLTGSGLLNLRVGKFNLLGFQFSRQRAPGLSEPAAAAVPVAENPAVLDDSQMGFLLYGRPRNGPFFYELALVTGVGPSASAGGGHVHRGIFSTDLNDFKDVFVRVSYTTPGKKHRFGALGYFGNTFLGYVLGTTAPAAREDAEELRKQTVLHNGVHPGFLPVSVEDRFRILGLDVEVNFGALNVRGAMYFAHHGNPFTNNVWVDYQSGLGEVGYLFSHGLQARVQYDKVYAKYYKAVEKEFLTPYVGFRLTDHVRISAEYNLDLDRSENSRAFFLMDFSI